MVGSRPPTAVVGVAAFLVAVALFACWLPARRAARVDPVVALRRCVGCAAKWAILLPRDYLSRKHRRLLTPRQLWLWQVLLDLPGDAVSAWIASTTRQVWDRWNEVKTTLRSWVKEYVVAE